MKNLLIATFGLWLAAGVQAKTPSLLVVVSSETNLDTNDQAKIFALVSDSVNRAFLSGFESLYFGSQSTARANLSGAEKNYTALGTTLGLLRENLLDVSHEIHKAAGRGYYNLNVEAFWTFDDLPEQSEALAQSLNGMVSFILPAPQLEGLRSTLQKKGVDIEQWMKEGHSQQFFETVLGSRFYDNYAKDLSTDSYQRKAHEVYRYFSMNYPGQMIPLGVQMLIGIADGAIRQAGGATLTVKDLVQRGPEKQTSPDAKIMYTQMRPGWSHSPLAMMVTYDSVISRSRKDDRQEATIRFGVLKEQSYSVTPCLPVNESKNSCRLLRDMIPTTKLKLTVPGFIRRWGASALGLTEFEVLINTLTIDLQTMSIIRHQSQIPILYNLNEPRIFDLIAYHPGLSLEGFRASQLQEILPHINQAVEEALTVDNHPVFDMFHQSIVESNILTADEKVDLLQANIIPTAENRKLIDKIQAEALESLNPRLSMAATVRLIRDLRLESSQDRALTQVVEFLNRFARETRDSEVSLIFAELRRQGCLAVSRVHRAVNVNYELDAEGPVAEARIAMWRNQISRMKRSSCK